jgi:prevent-host-death family protein
MNNRHAVGNLTFLLCRKADQTSICCLTTLQDKGKEAMSEMESENKKSTEPRRVGYGLPCAKCGTYYFADLDVCPVCRSRERVAVVPVTVKAMSAPAIKKVVTQPKPAASAPVTTKKVSQPKPAVLAPVITKEVAQPKPAVLAPAITKEVAQPKPAVLAPVITKEVAQPKPAISAPATTMEVARPKGPRCRFQQSQRKWHNQAQRPATIEEVAQSDLTASVPVTTKEVAQPMPAPAPQVAPVRTAFAGPLGDCWSIIMGRTTVDAPASPPPSDVSSDVSSDVQRKTVAAGDFKAKWSQLLDEVNMTRDPIVITRRGRPVAMVVPAQTETGRELGSS